VSLGGGGVCRAACEYADDEVLFTLPREKSESRSLTGPPIPNIEQRSGASGPSEYRPWLRFKHRCSPSRLAAVEMAISKGIIISDINSCRGGQLRLFSLLRARPRPHVAALGVGASAWKTSNADQLIGWTTEQATTQLAISLAPPTMHSLSYCRGFPSQKPRFTILALVHRRLHDEWQARYRTIGRSCSNFVEKHAPSRAPATRPPNWQHLGDTQGRGSSDTTP